MNKPGTDPKVKKTLVRNYQSKVKPTERKKVVREVNVQSIDCEESPQNSQKENELNHPTLCSSEALANYLADVKKSKPPPHSLDNIDKGELNTKITKKLNYQLNDKIYRNLIELNTNVDNHKIRRDKQPTSSTSSLKRDVEPNIEDFYEDEKEIDSIVSIPIIKPKFRPVRNMERGQLHALVASFEDI